mmetsp:Transcript_4207/g.7254  ORF Transcript_4207/g.7254 Transcript_4207/m.7254 type:complete len:327 (-) Transcript_4207:52-1032(-)
MSQLEPLPMPAQGVNGGGGTYGWVNTLKRKAQVSVTSSYPVTKGMACALVVGFVLQLAIGDVFRKQFALVPAKVIPKFWMLFSASLVELNLLQLVVNLVVLFFVGNLLEPLWGWKELVKFLAIINGASFAMLMATYILIFICANMLTILYAQVGGFSVSIAGLLVGLKQALPEEELGLGSVSIRYKNLPLLYLGVCFVATGIFENGSFFLMALYGTLSAWFYIRKYQQRPDSGTHGDQSDSFRLVTLFPEMVHPTIESLSSQASQMIFKKKAAGSSGGTGVGNGDGLPTSSSDNPEAARRRERGAKALEERLEEMASKDKASVDKV